MRNAVILAGGKGVRFAAGAEESPKPMAVVQGKPILHYIISLLKNIGFKQLYVIVGHRKESIIDYFGDGSAYGLRMQYIDNRNIDSSRKSGLSDAVLLVKDVMKEPFMTILGDEIYAATAHGAMLSFFERNPAHEAVIAVHRGDSPDEVKKNYSVKLEGEGTVVDLEEKPRDPWNNYVGCGTYIFRPSIFEYIERTAVSPRSGRRELADSMKLMLGDGKKIFAFDIGGEYLNINYPGDLAAADRIIGGTSGNNR